MTPAEVDGCEVWQVAAALGAHEDHPAEPEGGHGRPVRSRRDFIAERMAHAAGRGPKPEADPPTAEAVALVSRLAAR
jgi:hypothetical protein